MKKIPFNRVLAISIVIFLLSISSVIFLLLRDNQNNNLPQLQLYNWSNEHSLVRPLLMEYTDRNKNQTKKLVSSDEQTRYLDDKNNIMHEYTLGIIHLDFWDLGVVKVTATIDGKPVSVRRTDGEYYIDYPPSKSVMKFEVVSMAERGTAKYIFMVYTPDDGDSARYQEAKKALAAALQVEDSSLVMCGYEKFDPYLASEGYVLKRIDGNGGVLDAYGIDAFTHAMYLRDITGKYHPLSGKK